MIMTAVLFNRTLADGSHCVALNSVGYTFLRVFVFHEIRKETCLALYVLQASLDYSIRAY